MADQLKEAVKVAEELGHMKAVRCQGTLLPKLREVILGLKNLEKQGGTYRDPVYEDFEDDVEWLKENTLPPEERHTDWDSYLTHVWPDREEDFIECATEESETLDILIWAVEIVCDLIEKIVKEHGNDVKNFSERERKVVAALPMCVMLLRTIIETPIEDQNGYFEGKVPTWIRLVRHDALTLPRGV